MKTLSQEQPQQPAFSATHEELAVLCRSLLAKMLKMNLSEETRGMLKQSLAVLEAALCRQEKG
jgi:hypothetical protein